MTSHDRSVEDWNRHLSVPMARAELLAQLSAGSLTDSAASTARRFRTKTALRVGESAITHGDLDDRSRRLAGWLKSRGAGPGTCVIIALPNSLSFAVAYLAVLHSGAAVTLVHPGLRSREVSDMIDLIRPVVSIGSADRMTQLVQSPRAGSVLGTEETLGDTMNTAIASTDPLSVQDLPAPTIAHLALTSGTTGKPKLTPLTHANILASVRAVALAWRWSENDVLVHGLPLQHAHGLTAIHLSVLTGSTSIVFPEFDADALCESAEQQHATVMFGVPSVYDRLLRSDRFNAQRLGSLRLVVSGSAPLPPDTFEAINAAIGQPPLERYGLTEAGFALSNHYDGVRRAGSVGFPLPGVELRLVDDDGSQVEDGIDGEITIRGPQVFGGYRPTGDDDTSSFLRGGWFRTGDIGCRSPETGAVSITGRLKELIVTGGLNVYPREVELVLESLPGVAMAAVVGIPSADWGEAVTAAVVQHPGASVDLDAMAAAVRGLLAPYKRPKNYHIVEELPRNHMGKLMRAALVAHLIEKSGDPPMAARLDPA